MSIPVSNKEPIALVIFGVTGDLTKRKLTPALYELLLADRLPQPLYIIGFARRDWDEEAMRTNLCEGIREFARTQPMDEGVVGNLLSKMLYIQSPFEDESGYRHLGDMLRELGVVNCLFYLATPPEAYPVIIRQIGRTRVGMRMKGWTRIVIEKPYGRDLTSAQSLDADVHQVFDETQVYRIDHYL